MTQYQAITGPHAEWVQPKTRERRFELRIGDAPAASLTYRSRAGTLAVAETARGRWTLKRVGFINSRITIREEGAETDLAVLTPHMWGQGALVFRDRSSYAWQAQGVWRRTWSFIDAAGRPILHFRQGLEDEKLRDAFRTQAAVTIEPGAPEGERLEILLVFGMYLIVGSHDDEAATAAIIAAIG